MRPIATLRTSPLDVRLSVLETRAWYAYYALMARVNKDSHESFRNRDWLLSRAAATRVRAEKLTDQRVINAR
jgi:hypothetical protein